MGMDKDKARACGDCDHVVVYRNRGVPVRSVVHSPTSSPFIQTFREPTGYQSAAAGGALGFEPPALDSNCTCTPSALKILNNCPTLTRCGLASIFAIRVWSRPTSIPSCAWVRWRAFRRDG